MIPDWLELSVMIPDWLELSVMIPDWLELSVMIPDWLELCVMIPDWLELSVMIPDWLELSVMIPDWLELSVMIPDWLELSTEGVHELCESGVPLELGAGAAITLVSHHDAMEVVVERPEPVLLEQLQAMVETERQCKVSLHHTKGEALRHRVETVHVKKMKQG